MRQQKTIKWLAARDAVVMNESLHRAVELQTRLETRNVSIDG